MAKLKIKLEEGGRRSANGYHGPEIIKGVRHKLLFFKSLQNAYPHETTPKL
jgi:hypothetical protein